MRTAAPRLSSLRLLPALLAVLAMVLGPVVSARQASAAQALDALLRDHALCLADAGQTPPAKTPLPHHQAHDCLLCPAGCHLANFVALPAGGGAIVPVPARVAVAHPAPPPPSTGPPYQGRYAVSPRAPPALFI